MTDPKHSRAVYDLRETFIAFVLRQLGEAYIWGANGGTAQDCSGLVTEAMRTFRALTQDTTKDRTAHGWLHYFLDRGCLADKPYRGCLIGWDNPKAGHIAICLNERFCIEASGGSWTDYDRKPAGMSREDWRRKCIEKGAQVCIRTIGRDRTVHAIVDPFLAIREPF
jgi:cell wall-associated NlpC family hydrolase